MNFTFAEIDVLISRGYLDKDQQNTFGINYGYKSTNQGFGSYSVRKSDDGEIITQSARPINVDCDDGTYDMEYETDYYKTFEDFVNHKPYKTV